MLRSTSWTPTRALRAISLSEVPRPPRVGSRSTCRSGQTVSIAATSRCRAALSVTIWVPNSRPSRTLMIAMPCTPIGAADDDHVADRGAVRVDVDPGGDQPDAGGVHVHLITVSGVDDLGVAGDDPHPGGPGRRRPCPARPGRPPTARCPPPGRSRRTGARGTAPLMARSLTVPLTARWPIEPPGKNSGRTTNVSVEKASRAPPISNTAESRAARRRAASPNAGTKR